MVLEGLLNVAKGGMNTQLRTVERAAQVIANPQSHPEADISGAILDSEMAVQAFKANATVFEAGLEFWELMRLSNPDE